MDDLQLVLEFGKSSDTIGNYKSKPFIELPFGLVKIDIPTFLRENNIKEAVEKIMSIQYSDFDINQYSQNEIISFVLWIKEQLEFILNIEQNYLHTEPKPELLAAGINRLDEFGVMVTIDNLAGGDILKYDKIKTTPYYEIYQKLKLDKIQSEIRERYEKILMEKVRKK